MGEYHIVGGYKISGEMTINGGKNAILPILASVVLNSSESIIHNCPLISDTYVAVQILEAIGCNCRWEGTTLIVDSKPADCYEVPEELVREMRSSIIFLGGVLARFNKVKISYPGGCEKFWRRIFSALKVFTVYISSFQDTSTAILFWLAPT